MRYFTSRPCGGKSTVQSIISDVFADFGWKETATTLLSGGVKFSELSAEQAFQFQKDLLQVMLRIEETFFNLAHAEAQEGNKCLVICDRGTMDASAYISKDEWARILSELGLNEVEIRDQRYDCVVHLITAANGAAEFYNLGNNHARSEDLDLAKTLDLLCQNAWIGHPYFELIDNSTSFDRKCHRVVASVLERIGLPDPRYGSNVRKFKFLIPCDYEFSSGEFPVAYNDFEVEHIYLPVKQDGSQARIRRRTQDGVSHFSITTRKIAKSNNSAEYRRSLSGREFEALVSQADPERVPILKKRRCFVYESKSFQLDLFVEPSCMKGQMILEVYLPEDHHDQCLPPFLPITKDVTNDEDFSHWKIALVK